MPRSAEGKLRLAWFSPLNLGGQDSISVSAYASELLLPHLAQHFEIELFHNGFEQHQDFPTHHYVSAYAVDRANPFDLVFYQLEDARTSNFVRVHLGQMPGLVWFHDIIFTSFGPEPILNSPWQYALRKFNDPKLEWPERGEELEQFGPFGFRESAWAWRAIFSNPASHAEYRRSCGMRLSTNGMPEESVCLPLPIPDQPTAERSAADVLRVGFCGSARIEQRAHKVLQALAELERPYKLYWLLEQAEREHAMNLAAEFEVTHIEFVVGRSPRAWQGLSKQIDVALHPLFSVYGQPDPYLALSMAAELPCMVTTFGAPDYLPTNAFLAIEPGQTESSQILDYLRQICAGQHRQTGLRAREYALQRCTASIVARDLVALLLDSASRYARFRAAWANFESQARLDVAKEALTLAGPAYGAVGKSNCESDLGSPINASRLIAPIMEEFGWLK
ncbi:MAG: hypothetical protein K1X79_06530 [Oligoflexia bacterium]|nr:hypothetical protein [Oligoflexia bacterium]